jgi:hypothetical protein
MIPIKGTEQVIKCDALILSVGLIPENEVAGSLNVPIDNRTKGPICNQQFMTNQEGIYCCGNALHVNDLVDYVSESGIEAGANAAAYSQNKRDNVLIKAGKEFLYLVPQVIDRNLPVERCIEYFRVSKDVDDTILTVTCNGTEIFKKKYPHLRSTEMEKITLDFKELLASGGDIEFKLTGGGVK